MVSQWLHSTFRALGSPGYLILWAGTTFAFLAFGMSMIVQSAVAFDLTGKNGAVGIVGMGMGVATILIAPFGGVLADRLSKRRLLLVGQTIIGLKFLAIGILIVTGHITIFWLFASTFLLGAVFSFIGPARQAWIGEILPQPLLANGIALQQLGMTATRILGPAIAGIIILSFAGTAGGYFFMAGLFIFVVFSLTRVPGGRVPAARRADSTLVGDLLLGLRHLKERPRVGLLVISFIGFVVAGFSYQVVLPGYLEHEFGRPPGHMSFLFTASGVSGLLATMILASMSDSRHAFRLMLAGALATAVAIALTSVAPTFLFAMGAMLLLGAGSSAFQLLNSSLVMQESAPEYHGRVMSLIMLAWGINSIAMYPFGRLGDRIGERETLMVMAIALLVVTAITTIALTIISRTVPAPSAASRDVPASGGGS